MKIVKRILKIVFFLILIPLLYVIIAIAHGTMTDFQPEEVLALDIDKAQKIETISDSTDLSFIIWNVGYGGLGEESDFFYDNGGFLTSKGKMVRAPKENVEKNIKGAVDFLKNNPADFYLFQ